VLQLKSYQLISIEVSIFATMGSVWPKTSGGRGRPQQQFFLSENQNDQSFRWYKNVDTSFFRFVTMHAFDRQTDGQKDRQKGLRNTMQCITCSCTVKMSKATVE